MKRRRFKFRVTAGTKRRSQVQVTGHRKFNNKVKHSEGLFMFIYLFHFWVHQISFPERTCLLVSAKTRSNQLPESSSFTVHACLGLHGVHGVQK